MKLESSSVSSVVDVIDREFKYYSIMSNYGFNSLVKKFKLVFLGEQSGEYAAAWLMDHVWLYRPVFILVGKTSIITKFMYDSFDETYQVAS